MIFMISRPIYILVHVLLWCCVTCWLILAMMPVIKTYALPRCRTSGFAWVLYVHLMLICLIGECLHLKAAAEEDEKLYIVYMGGQPDEEAAAIEEHKHMLSLLKRSDDEDEEIYGVHRSEKHVHSYTKSFNGFVAKLSPAEANKLARLDNVVSVFPNQYHKLHTTRSWDFIGFLRTAPRSLEFERDVVIGLLDTGITPDSQSFNDKGLTPADTKWKGSCYNANFSCNNKIIGARFFKLDGTDSEGDILTPLDSNGHGTHTASTAAGREVAGASLSGLASGVARGAVPDARIAMYKVCWESSGCSDVDILAAFDVAIYDGVDILSISLGGLFENYAVDSIAIGSFHAMKKGILTVVSAGNGGPKAMSVVNHAPWVLTVAASGIDRGFLSSVSLGKVQNIWGTGVSLMGADQKLYPLIAGVDAAIDSTAKDNAKYCVDGSINPEKVKGKIVFCEGGKQQGIDSVIAEAGGIGEITQSSVYPDIAKIFMLPGTRVNVSAQASIIKYMNSARFPSASISKTQQVKISAPFVASFSSRGPNPGSIHVLKPDVAAPGLNILAAYTPLQTLTGLKGDTQYSKFTLMSGTSMACPHVAGAAAYVKSFHPNWSPSAIKSAIMTTATPMSKQINHDAEFAHGAGQLNPTKATNPGLVYDMNDASYIDFLCLEGYDARGLAIITGAEPVDCSAREMELGYDALNYPTMQMGFTGEEEGPIVGVFKRTVTNVGPASSTYNAVIEIPKGVKISVSPATLSFSRVSQTRSFEVIVNVRSVPAGEIVSGSLVWKSSDNAVRSAIVIYNYDQASEGTWVQ